MNSQDDKAIHDWCEREPLDKVLKHVGHSGGIVTIGACRIACARASQEIERLRADLNAYDLISRRLISKPNDQ